MLEGSFLADAHRRDLPLLHLRLAADAHHIAVAYRGCHAVAVAFQCKVRVPCRRDSNIAFNVLLRRNGRAAGNGADQRHLHHLRQRPEPRRDGLLECGLFLPAHQVGGGGFQRICKCGDLGLWNVRLPVFYFTDRGLILIPPSCEPVPQQSSRALCGGF